MPKVKTHKFPTGVYRIHTDGVDGYCDENGEICVQPNLKPERELEVWVHESIHAEFHEATEAKVTASAYNIARLLWRLGYRKVKK